MRTPAWRIPVYLVGGSTVAAFGIGVWQLLCDKQIEAASWVMASGGLGVIVFALVQLHREAQREQDRVTAARAKLKPAARLARRMCEKAVIDSNGKGLNQWLARWYLPARARLESDLPDPIQILEDRLRETVTLAAEAGAAEVEGADAALDKFILAADIINELAPTYGVAVDSATLQGVIPQGRQAANHLAEAAASLEPLAKRNDTEPKLPVNPKFVGEQ